MIADLNLALSITLSYALNPLHPHKPQNVGSNLTFGKDWLLTGQLFQDLGGSGKSITGLSDTDVDAQLSDTQRSHDVLELVILVVLLLALLNALDLLTASGILSTDSSFGGGGFVSLSGLLL